MTRLHLPDTLQAVPYNGACVPGSVSLSTRLTGANCQLFAYTLLAHYGVNVAPWRSSDLWADASMSDHVETLEPLDLLLWNRTPEAWGAHVGVHLREGYAVHLSKKVGVPAVWPLERFLEEPAYRVFIGAKRLRKTADAFALYVQ